MAPTWGFAPSVLYRAARLPYVLLLSVTVLPSYVMPETHSSRSTSDVQNDHERTSEEQTTTR